MTTSSSNGASNGSVLGYSELANFIQATRNTAASGNPTRPTKARGESPVRSRLRKAVKNEDFQAIRKGQKRNSSNFDSQENRFEK
jgi:hypothetical protein